jgi:hypothetical protein
LFVLLLISVPIGLLVLWGVAYDVRHRRDPLTGNNPGAAAKKLRAEGGEKASEWGAGGL